VVLLYFSKPVPSVICVPIVVLGCIRCAYRSDRGLLQRFPNTVLGRSRDPVTPFQKLVMAHEEGIGWIRQSQRA
jgi:hypothetical protein